MRNLACLYGYKMFWGLFSLKEQNKVKERKKNKKNSLIHICAFLLSLLSLDTSTFKKKLCSLTVDLLARYFVHIAWFESLLSANRYTDVAMFKQLSVLKEKSPFIMNDFTFAK